MPVTLGQIAKMTESQLVGDPDYKIDGISDLETASPSDISFLDLPRYGQMRHHQAMKTSNAGAIFIAPGVDFEKRCAYLIHPSPSRAFQIVMEYFFASKDVKSGFDGVHKTAIIHDEAVIESDVTIHPFAVIDKKVKIGRGSFIGSGCYIGPCVTIGESCYIYANVIIREFCRIGNNVIIQAGSVIGSCGFGYVTDTNGKHTKLKQLGNVVIDDDVEIGANTTIDRARFKTTKICSGTKIDNLVQIAHGVTIDKDTLICAQVGIAGSSSIGKKVVLTGQTAVTDHTHIGDGVIIGARGGVTKPIKKPGVYAGTPAIPMKDYHLQTIHVRRLEEYIKRIENLEKRLNKLEKDT